MDPKSQDKPARNDKPRGEGQRNEGEGNQTAAREYNREAANFATSGRVDVKAREAERAIRGAEGDALRRAEEKGKAHSHGEDPALRAPRREADE